jgi:UDP-N-acetylglucosamine diphosphorylase/glucosamine-1-phosphate N-acetyltransferase
MGSVSEIPVFLFEDDDYERFYPLAVSRPSFLLRLGIDLIYEKWQRALHNNKLGFLLRGGLAAAVTQRTGLPCNRLSGVSRTGALFINGRFLPDDRLLNALSSLQEGAILMGDDALVAAYVSADSTASRQLEMLRFWGYGHFKELVKSLPKQDVDASGVKHIWDFIRLNPMQIEADFKDILSTHNDRLVADSAVVDKDCLIYNGADVCIRDAALIDGQVVIDARNGPVYIDSGAAIQPHTRIEGPCYVGRKSMLVGGKIREGCSIGPVCKIGGEVEESIVLGYSNKFHDGFLGHAYLGEWVNLGAGTTNSDLKNNYGNIRVDLGTGLVDSGLMKVGSFIADHVKTGIGTMLNTGMTIGYASNIFGAGLVSDKSVPPFCWGGTGSYCEYDLQKATQTAETVARRRGIEFTEIDRMLFKAIFEESREQRRRVTGYT